jgi:hypothetical protein
VEGEQTGLITKPREIGRREVSGRAGDLYAPCRDPKTKKREKNRQLAAKSSCQFGLGNDRSLVGWGGGWEVVEHPVRLL